MTSVASDFDFAVFLQRIATLDYAAILVEAERECARVEGISFGVKGAVKRREADSVEYVSNIKAFLFYMRSGTRPGSASDREFQMYRPVVEALVSKGQFKPETLNAFTSSSHRS